jgi:hypothetical protein
MYCDYVAHRTPKQTEASRLNGAKSRGRDSWKPTPLTFNVPVNNDIRSQHLADSVVYPGESNDLFIEFVNKLMLRFQPANEGEAGIIEDLAKFRWREMRATSLMHSLAQAEMLHYPGPAPNRVLAMLRNKSPDLALLREEERMWRNEFQKSMRALMQAKRLNFRPNSDAILELTTAHSIWTEK